MQLWTDYEGVTIDGTFPLQKLLLPEGRSAFFSTSGPQGEPTVVRLIECHFDEDEILARWHSVSVLNHPHFLKLERYGRIELDGGPVAYAVFEKVDANLAAVLDQGHLTVKDVAQLGLCLAAALDALHTHGFVHEHLEPRSVFAVGEQVKLRTDCIREAPEGEEGRAAKQRDVRDLARVLLQALTQRDVLEGIPEYAVPQPFGNIVRHGLDGTWGLKEIRSALESGDGSALRAGTSTSSEAGEKAPSIAARPEPNPASAVRPPRPPLRNEPQLSLPLDDEERDASRRNAEFAHASSRFRDRVAREQGLWLRRRWAGAAGIAALVLLLLAGLVHAWKTHRHEDAPPAAAVSQPAAPRARQSMAAPAATASPKVNPAAFPGGSRDVWRVIAFTYRRRADAEKKVAGLKVSHPELEPVVFSARGHSPYLISIGGAMSRDAAYALARRARSMGLPRDSYAQNYSH